MTFALRLDQHCLTLIGRPHGVDQSRLSKKFTSGTSSNSTVSQGYIFGGKEATKNHPWGSKDESDYVDFHCFG